MKGRQVVFHIDANSAYLSWEAVYRLQHGAKVDLRKIPAVVGGNEENRHGIVLAKSIPAKAYNIKTGETLYSARQKCPSLVVVPPNYGLYMKCSNAMYEILQEYSPYVQRFSVDECFLLYPEECLTEKYGEAEAAAYHLKERIKNELGFTVNIGVSTNKLLAKMAGELKKPDLVHTIWPEEIKTKLWPLPVEELFMVGRATKPKLHLMGIRTIGDLAQSDPKYLEQGLKSHGLLIWRYANGIDNSQFGGQRPFIKGIGNSTTTAFNVEDQATAYCFLLSLTEMVAYRLRQARACCRLVAISLKDNSFNYCSHQRKFTTATDSTQVIYKAACRLFDELWQKRQKPLRQLGVRVSELTWDSHLQLSLFNYQDVEKQQALDVAIDNIRRKYGPESIIRSVFLHSGIAPLSGGVGEKEYQMMTSIL